MYCLTCGSPSETLTCKNCPQISGFEYSAVSDILFVDDEKSPTMFDLPEDTVVATTPADAIDLWKTQKFHILYLDHDLDISNPKTNGADLLIRMCGTSRPTQVFSISLNQNGAKRIKQVCWLFDIPFEDLGANFFEEG